MKRWRTTLIVAGVFLALLAYILFVEREREPPPAPGVTPSPTPVQVLDLSTDDLRTLTIDDGTRTLHVVQGTETWTVDERPADDDAIGWRVDQLSSLQARLIVSEEVDDPATYGLTPPALTLRLELTSGESAVIHVGRETPDRTARYVQREGDARLYVVEVFQIEALFEWLDAPPYAPTPTPET